MAPKSILIIPSWLSLHGVKGSFFREQAEVMSDRFDMHFLYGEEVFYNNLVSVIKYLYSLRRPRPLTKEEIGRTKYHVFKYPRFLFLNENLNFKIKKAYYRFFLKVLIKNENCEPNLIHAQCTFDGGLIANYLSKNFGIPYIITEHNLFLLHDLNKGKVDDGVAALENASRVLVVSHDKARQILMHNINVRPIVIGNLIESSIFYYKERVPALPEIVIMIVGQFSFIKDYPTFFESMAILRSMTDIKIKLKCVGFNIWGHGDNSIKIKKLADIYNLKDIDFYENVERHDMNKFYWDCDLLVMTSIAEGLPVSVLESLACGRPVFSTRCGGVEDVVNNSNGRIVPIKSPLELANEILRFINKEITFDGRQFSEEILAQFSAKAFSNRVGEVYNSVIN